MNKINTKIEQMNKSSYEKRGQQHISFCLTPFQRDVTFDLPYLEYIQVVSPRLIFFIEEDGCWFFPIIHQQFGTYCIKSIFIIWGSSFKTTLRRKIRSLLITLWIVCFHRFKLLPRIWLIPKTKRSTSIW
jgi:hypothetical protein